MLRTLSRPSLQVNNSGFRAYHITLHHTYQQSLAEGFQGSVADFQRIRGNLMHQGRSAEALAHGYRGSLKECHLAEKAVTVKKRSTGSCPYISTLRKVGIPSASQLICFNRFPSQPSSAFVAYRWVLKDGHGLPVGLAKIVVFAPEVAEDEELWLFPYFDPVTKTLAFQRPDGTDHPCRKSLLRLATADALRPLLRLAQMEDLLDKVPDGSLSSLSLTQVRESGYAIYSRITVTGEAQCTFRVKSQKTARLRFYPAVEKDRQSIVFLPYIADDGYLRLWDAEMDAPMVIRSHKGLHEGWDAQTVRRRFPVLFRAVQSLRYWMDVV